MKFSMDIDSFSSKFICWNNLSDNVWSNFPEKEYLSKNLVNSNFVIFALRFDFEKPYIKDTIFSFLFVDIYFINYIHYLLS